MNEATEKQLAEWLRDAADRATQLEAQAREREEDIRAALKTIHLLAAEVTALRLELAAARRAA